MKAKIARAKLRGAKPKVSWFLSSLDPNVACMTLTKLFLSFWSSPNNPSVNEKVPIEIRNTTDPSIKAVLIAMERSYRNDADLRPSARELADYLKSELDAVELPINVVDQIDLN